MKKTRGTVQEAREMQEQAFRRMLAYQKRTEQMVNRKRMNHHMARKG